MVDPLVLATVILLGSVAILSGALAVRHPLAFKIAHRNVRRARTRTILVVLGLLVGTAMISGSLVVGDTVQAINLHYTYLAAGYTDEGVYAPSPTGGYLYFPQATAQELANRTAGDPLVAGVAPMVLDRVQVVDAATGVPQTNLNLIGTDPQAGRALGSFTSVSGGTLLGPDPGRVLIDERAAQDLNASVGDPIVVFGARPLTATLQAIVVDDVRGGVLTGGLSGGNVFTDLSTAQYLMNVTAQVDFVAVTNVGSQVDGMGLSPTVSAHLNATLAEIPGTSGLSVHTILSDEVAVAKAATSATVTNFLVFGLFSIVAGAMLIVGIFAMTAEERKGEMGMLRAIGLPRRAIVLAYYFEGLFYSAGSALVGTLAGVAAGFGLMAVYTTFLPDSIVSGAVILSSFTFTNSSLLTSYLAGFLLTLATVTVASVRISRLNIVRAIRDVPEPPPTLRAYTYLAYLGLALGTAGGLLFATTYRGTSDVVLPVLGGATVIVAAGLIASRFTRNRIAFSAAGVGLLVWVGSEPLRAAVLGPDHSFTITVVFVMGMLMIAGALLLVAFNGPALARGLERLVSGRSGSTPVPRLGLAYPTRRAARTAITLAIFALVIFTLVVLATFTATVTGSLNDSIDAQSGGYTFFGTSARPIPDLPQAVFGNASLGPLFSTAVPLLAGVGYVNVSASGSRPYTDRVFAAPAGAPTDADFYATNQFPFLSTLHGMDAATTMHELAANGSVALVDALYSGSSSFTALTPHPTVHVGEVIRVSSPATGHAQNLTVIGILKTQVLTGVWINPFAASALGFDAPVGFLLTVHPGVSATLAAQKIKTAFFAYGLALYGFAEILATAIAQTNGQIGLLEVFIALGLVVGIAALGILAMRAVTERRREIGTIRATGMTRAMVLKVFLLEYAFVTLVGAVIGGALGVLLIYNLASGPSAATAGITALYVPWPTILVVIAAAGALATLAVIGPSLRAARLAPAEAIRSME